MQDVSHTENFAQFGEENLSSHFSVFTLYSFETYTWTHITFYTRIPAYRLVLVEFKLWCGAFIK